MKNVRISLLCPKQADLPEHSNDLELLVQTMINHLDLQLDKVLSDCPDLIVFPECCDRFERHNGESRNAYYQYRGNRIRDFLAKRAKENNCYIAYSAIRNVPEDQEFPFRNSIQILGRNGELCGIYDKNHCVLGEIDDYGIRCSEETPLFQLDFGTVACAICFDLNFNTVLESYACKKPDLILFSSAYHGGIKQEQWAYECRAYFAGAIINDEGRILSPIGTTIAKTTNYYDAITATINLDYAVAHIDFNESKFVAAKKKYGKDLTIFEPGHIGVVLLTCESEKTTIKEIVKEFEIELLDDYFDRVLKHRDQHLGK